MGDRLRDAVVGYLQDDCRRMAVCADETATCAEGSSCDLTQPYVDRLLTRVRRHVRVGTNLLPKQAARRLRAGHTRLELLAEAVRTAMEARDLERVGKAARRLMAFATAHERRERPFLKN